MFPDSFLFHHNKCNNETSVNAMVIGQPMNLNVNMKLPSLAGVYIRHSILLLNWMEAFIFLKLIIFSWLSFFNIRSSRLSFFFNWTVFIARYSISASGKMVKLCYIFYVIFSITYNDYLCLKLYPHLLFSEFSLFGQLQKFLCRQYHLSETQSSLTPPPAYPKEKFSKNMFWFLYTSLSNFYLLQILVDYFLSENFCN